MQDEQDGFVGCWRLDPAESHYSRGVPPNSAVYEIAKTSLGYRFTARWTLANGSENEVSFEGVLDGEAHPTEGGHVDALVTTRVDERRLDTQAMKAGEIVHHVVRILSADSQAMTITQTGPDGSGRAFRNVSVYRRFERRPEDT